MILSDLINIYNDCNDKIQQQLGNKEMIGKKIDDISNDICNMENKLRIYNECIGILQKFELSLKNKITNEIEVLITEGIRQILEEDNLQFKIVYNIKRGTIVVDFKIYDVVTKTEYDILNSFGGGLLDIIDIVFHIIFLYHSNLRKILILDERGKFISSDKQHNLGRFLKYISNKLNLQIILVSHKEQLLEVADNVIKIQKRNNKSIIEYV